MFRYFHENTAGRATVAVRAKERRQRPATVAQWKADSPRSGASRHGERGFISQVLAVGNSLLGFYVMRACRDTGCHDLICVSLQGFCVRMNRLVARGRLPGYLP